MSHQRCINCGEPIDAIVLGPGSAFHSTCPVVTMAQEDDSGKAAGYVAHGTYDDGAFLAAVRHQWGEPLLGAQIVRGHLRHVPRRDGGSFVLRARRNTPGAFPATYTFFP